RLDALYDALRATLVDDLLSRLVGLPPEFFERVVLDILVAIGYGGSRQDAAQHLGRTGDGGVDGVIRQDPLGTDLVYVQAKRYDRSRTVGSDDVTAFLGALQAHGVRRGVFLTTCRFTQPARDLAKRQNIALVDG